jgi:hypothetical protein
MKIANTLWKNIGAMFSQHKMDRTWILGGNLHVIMQHMQLIGTGNEGTTIELCSNCFRFISVDHPHGNEEQREKVLSNKK